MFSLHKKKRLVISVAVASLFIIPATIFAIDKLNTTDDSFALTYTIPTGYTTITDPNFYNCVATEFKEEFPDEEIPETGLTDEQLGEIKTLECSGYGKQDSEKIVNTTGLEKMISLIRLDLISNILTSIDISNNTVLTYLRLENNQLTSIISNNPLLKSLNVDKNKLINLDVSNNTELSRLLIAYNPIANLDLSNNNKLKQLYAGHNNLSVLDISNNPLIERLYADNIFIRISPSFISISPNMVYDFSTIYNWLDHGNGNKTIIENSEGYTFDEDNKLLTINDLAKTNGYIQLTYNGSYLFNQADHSTYKIQIPVILDFDTNEGTGTFEPMICYPDPETDKCSITLPNTQPMRVYYHFLGWADSADATTATYQPNSEIELGTNKTIYALWSHINQLSFDVNGGDNTIDNSACHADDTVSGCEILITSLIPTRNNYEFLGWADTEDATEARYQKGDKLTLTENKTVYAVWKEKKQDDEPGGDTPGGDDTPGDDTPGGDDTKPDDTKPDDTKPDEGATGEDDDEKESDIPDPDTSTSDTSAPDTGANTMNDNNGTMITISVIPITLAIAYIMIYYYHNKKSHIKFD